MNRKRHLHQRHMAILALAACGVSYAGALHSTDKHPAKPAVKKPTLYVVGYSHLDTQWTWTYPQVIREFIPNTLNENFALFDKYPSYTFNWTGSNRYRLMKEYYPAEYARLKQCIKQGRWFTAGSSVEEGDVNSPSEESLIRQVMYGNQYFKREFGTQSAEYMLPDCFGFPASLPSILAHCGLKGFSTQKLTWGSAVGIPFNVGNWVGPDGRSIVAALNAGDYGGSITANLGNDSYWVNRLAEDARKTGVPVDYRYYGVGDRGGSPREDDVARLVASSSTDGKINLSTGRADQMFLDLTAADRAKLPSYKGDLELTQHSAGSLTSEATQKKWNRTNELLADAAERASVTADWLGVAPYDRDRITDGWLRFLPGQFHDLMAGTALPLAYTYTWNDEAIAMNEFAGVIENSVGGVTRALDTRGPGVPIVVYNPLSIGRQDVAEATVKLPGGVPQAVQVTDQHGKAVPAQIVGRDGVKTKLIFLASAPSVGFATYSVSPAASSNNTGSILKVSSNSIENSRYKVTIDQGGDVSSIFDKMAQKELLSAPARLIYQYENPTQYPAWNMDWLDQSQPPKEVVNDPATIEIAENGPVRAALKVTRHHNGSKFVQTIRLSAGRSDSRVEFATDIDWQGKESALKAEFPLTASNPLATYNWGLGTVQRGNNDPKKYEVASHQWFDLTDKSGAYGVSVLNDTKYGSDKPSDNVLRLTLLYSPGVKAGYQHQATQDYGQHHMIYALEGHAGSWQSGDTQWQSARLSQPLITFQAPKHSGATKSFSLVNVSTNSVGIGALKKAEDSDEVIVRFNELAGSSAKGVHVKFASPVVSAREVDGQERTIGSATIDKGSLVFDDTAYRPRAFAIRLKGDSRPFSAPTSQSIPLPYNRDVISTLADKTGGDFDGSGRSLPGELMPDTIVSNGVTFKLGPKTPGANNAVVTNGQTVKIPAGTNRRLYFLSSSANGDTSATFLVGGKSVSLNIQAWNGYVGQWDTRLWDGDVPELTYDWHNAYAGLVPGYIKRAPIAWYADHTRLGTGENALYQFAYLYRYEIAVPDGVNAVQLPRNIKVRILAASVGQNLNEESKPASPLYETLSHAPTDGPSVYPNGGTYHDATTVSLSHSLYWTSHDKLRYTLDGSKPVATSPIYTGPILLSRSSTLAVAQFDEDGKSGPVTVAQFDVSDTTPPSVVSAVSASFASSVRIGFSEPLDKASATTVTNYSIEGTTIQSAALGADGKSVILQLAGPIASPNNATLKVDGVTDLAPTPNVARVTVPIELAKPAFERSEVQSFDGTQSGPTLNRVSGLPTVGEKPWSINMFVYTDEDPGELTLIAGIGDGRDRNGAERFLVKFQNVISFWGSNIDIAGSQGFDLHKWQMITLTYDGSTVKIYKNGVEIGSDSASFSNASASVRFAPAPAWANGHRFSGKIAGFTVWSQALAPDFVQGLLGSSPKE